MIRVAIEEVALFLIPFALYAIVLVLQRRNVLHLEHWSSKAVWLSMAGLTICIGGFLAAGVFAERHTGAYVPPHMENGEPVQGGFK